MRHPHGPPLAVITGTGDQWHADVYHRGRWITYEDGSPAFVLYHLRAIGLARGVVVETPIDPPIEVPR